MPVPMSRYDQSPSPPSIMNAPSRSTSYLKQPSNASYYSPTVIGNGQAKLNIVTRVAIEGKAKKGEDGASVRMYLKLAIPIDSVSTGTTVALFAEENVKIHSSQVHPLDSNSVPYNFSSGVSPLLKNAARALKLSARSSDTFSSAFNLSQTDASTSSNHGYDHQSDDMIPPVDVQYTGQIIVSGYNISYVLPKTFLTRKRDSMTSMDEEDNSMARTPARRRLSIGERNHAQFMAAIDMWIPFVSRPPRSPYMLSIPTPRCLHNHIKLRIFPPNNAATSFASLSSIEEDNTVWDLTSDPPVTRTSSRAPHQSSLSQHFADDESSDSSNLNIAEGCEIQGTFPSAERVRVRWAKPLKTLNIPGDNSGRRRVGVEEVKADMVCTVHGKGTSLNNPDVEGVLMDVEYKAYCRGVWFPGVATLLALDVGLEAKGSDITWPAGCSTQWEITGGAGFTGFDNGIEANRVGLGSRSSSTDSTLPADNESVNILGSGSRVKSSSSLLRAPLPAQNMPDYSFEGQGASSSSSTGTLPSVSSLPASSTPFLNPPAQVCPPGSPVSLHLNMNELQPSSNNSFTFKICGTILVTARTNLARVNGLNSSGSSNGDKKSDPEPIVLPRLTVLAADAETTAISIRNAVDSAVIEVYHPTGDIYSDPQTRKTVLQKGGFTRCGDDGGRMALKFLDAFNMTVNGVHGQGQPSRPRTSSNGMPNRSSSSSIPRNISARHRREGPAIIPSVAVTVTALAPDADMFPTGYAVRVRLQTPTSNNNEFLEFGVAHSSKETSRGSTKPQRKVHIICATLDGVAVKSEVTKVSKVQAGKNASGFPLEDLSATEWICWAKVFCGNTPGCLMIIDYLVQHHEHKYPGGERGQTINALDIDLLLPIFFVSVARYEVAIDVMPSLEIAGLRSNFDYHHAYPTGSRLLRYSLEEYSQSQLVLTMKKPGIKSTSFPRVWKVLMIVTWVALLTTSFRHNSWVQLQVTEGVNPPSSVLDAVDVADFVRVPDPTTFESIVDAQAPHLTTMSTLSEPMTSNSAITVQQEASAYIESLSVAPLPTDEPTAEHHHHRNSEKTQTTVQPLQSELADHYGLIPVDKLFIFDWSAKQTLGRVVAAIEAIWNICRTVYHYPLPPP